jgi:NAD(P)-dependent dehydrogenase (short-subunit alcohol dehydrogenase family)
MGIWVITGANRGLGLEFVTQLSKDGLNTIIATSRSMSRESLGGLQALDIKFNLHILECDTSSPDSIESFGKQVTALLDARKIDFLLNNAGVNTQSELTSLNVTPEAITENVSVNVIGPAKIVQVLERHLQSGSVVMNMTSGLGSLTDTSTTDQTKCTAYSISKAGLNILTLHQASNLKKKEVVVVCVDPGVSIFEFVLPIGKC